MSQAVTQVEEEPKIQQSCQHMKDVVALVTIRTAKPLSGLGYYILQGPGRSLWDICVLLAARRQTELKSWKSRFGCKHN